MVQKIMKEKSITIHGISEELDKKIQEKSRQYKLSQNKTVKKILEDSLFKEIKNEREKEFSDLFGIWSKEDEKEFCKKIKDLDVVDPNDWK
jgi:hypothetical protein